MDVVYAHCCGIDVHKRFVTACRIRSREGAEPEKELRKYGTMTGELLAMAEWLAAGGVTHVAMESTGVYWKPIWNLLEERFTLVLVNAQHVKAVPGRKTDLADAEWLADLLRHRLLRGSFVPTREERERRELTRYRTSLVRVRSAEVNRLAKTLEGANIKLGSVVSDLTGVSARLMLEALVEGNNDPGTMADLAKGTLRTKREQLTAALSGRMSSHQQFMVAQHLIAIDGLDAQIVALSEEIAERLVPFENQLALLVSIPGVGRRTAEILLAECGTDMSRFPSAGHLASWAGMCPGQHESGGKRFSGRTRHGSPWLRSALVESAQAAARTKQTELAGRHHRLAVRRGRKRASVAIGRQILEIAYHLLSTGAFYDDTKLQAKRQQDTNREKIRLIRKLEKMGHTVVLMPAA